jgi:NAD(P)-dependent dehydrogenase (short-subunit alcohol dehydrogenase family)
MDDARARESAAEIGGLAWQADVTDTDAVAALAQDTAQALGPIGILVTSAGIA